MKYSDKNRPLCCMQTNSTCYKGTSIMTVKGVLWHSTGANNNSLKRYVQPSDDAVDRDKWLELLGKNNNRNDWNHINIDAGLNCWIGELADGTVTTVQTMPWNYRPWGCGSGSKGSCNSGWIQFEICEDDLTDPVYFEKAYKEACEITAYLCKMYNIDPFGAVDYNGVKVPTILCHADSCELGFGSNHGDINHWFPKFGKSMETARADVAELMGKKVSTIEPAKPIYRVRKDWEDAASQIGAFSDLDNAKEVCDKAGEGYEVYNDKGIAIYPNISTQPEEDEDDKTAGFPGGTAVSLVPGATYADGKAIPAWLFKSKLYTRSEVRKDGTVIFSIKTTGPITGVVKAKDLVKYGTIPVEANPEPTFTPYIVRIDTDVLNVRAGAGTGYKINTQVKRHGLYTIVAEDGVWGKLKSGAGWINLDYTQKIK